VGSRRWESFEANCAFTVQHARRYMKVADVKRNTRVRFDQADSIRDVLDLKDTKPEPAKVHRAATLDDLRRIHDLPLDDFPSVLLA